MGRTYCGVGDSQTDLDLDKAGIKLDADGFIQVDDELRTNVDGIWALGDCNRRGGFTHTSYNDFEIVAANLLDGGARRVTDRIKTYATFIDPPLGRAGISQTEARTWMAKHPGKRVFMATRPMEKVARAVEKGETQGFRDLVDDDQANLRRRSLEPGDEAIHCIST